jgi:hypothetical protein
MSMPQEQLPTGGAGVQLATATEAIRGAGGAPTQPPPSNFTRVLWYIGQLVTIFS